MILFRADAILASSISKIGKWADPWNVCDDFKSFTESTNSTSLIHHIASDSELDQALTWFLNLIFRHENVEGVGNLSKWSSEISSFCWSTMYFCGYTPSAGKRGFLVDGLPASLGVEKVFLFCSSFQATGLSVLGRTGSPSVASRFQRMKHSSFRCRYLVD